MRKPRLKWTPAMAEYVEIYCTTRSDAELADDLSKIYGVPVTKKQVAIKRYYGVGAHKERGCKQRYITWVDKKRGVA